MSDAATRVRVIETVLSEAETIALAYYSAHHRDGWAALVHALEDALADLGERDAAIRAQGRAISLGYTRGQPVA